MVVSLIGVVTALVQKLVVMGARNVVEVARILHQLMAEKTVLKHCRKQGIVK